MRSLNLWAGEHHVVRHTPLRGDTHVNAKAPNEQARRGLRIDVVALRAVPDHVIGVEVAGIEPAS